MSKKTTKILSAILAASMAMSLMACNSKDDDEPGSEPGSVPGVSDPENTYYSSKLVSIPRRTDTLYAFAKEGGDEDTVCLISLKTDGECCNVDSYRMYLCNYDGEILSECEPEIPKEYFVYQACDIDGSKFVVTGTGADFMIIDYDGHVLKESDTSTATEYGSKSVCKTHDGFMILAENTVTRYDKDGGIIDEITNTNTEYTLTGVFEQDGRFYVLGREGLVCGEGDDCYFELNFARDAVEKACSVSDVTDMVTCPWEGVDYHTYYCSSFGNDIVEYDIMGQSSKVVAKKNNMLVAPSTYVESSYVDPQYKMLDETHFYRDYLYSGTELDVTEVALISVDTELDLGSRTVISLKGYNIIRSFLLEAALYNYNTSQDEYFIKVEDLMEDTSSVESYSELGDVRLQLMSDFANGDTPDIFLGDFFDYNYMGENNLVLDLKSYLGDDHIYDRMTRDDGKIYQVYAGYNVEGFWGRADKYSNNNSLSSMPAVPEGQSRFIGIPATDLAYYTIGSDLCGLYRRGELTQANVKQAVEFALENGIEPSNDMTADAFPMYDMNPGDTQLEFSGVGGPASYWYLQHGFRNDMSFVGYPQATGSVHMLIPECLMAVSASTEHPEECIKFIRSFMTPDVQRRIAATGTIPVSTDVLNEMIQVVKDPENATTDQRNMYKRQIITDYNSNYDEILVPLSDQIANNYLEQIAMADTVMVYDWGVWAMTEEEINTHYSQGKSAAEIADSLYSRLLVYARENYG